MSEAVRLYTYRELLRSRRVVSRHELMQRLEISAATLKRDLAKLRDQMNTPIVFDRELGGYRLESADAMELPGVWFTADEMLALLTLQHLVVELMPSLLGPKLRPLQRKIDEMLRKQGLDPQALVERIRWVHAGRRRIHLAHFEALARGTLERKRVRIRHINRERGEQRERDISPQQLVHYRDNWYVDAKCHLRREIRCFALDAIEEAQVLDTPADEVDQDLLRQSLQASYGIFSGTPEAWARLRFSAQRARWVKNEQWHPAQRQTFEADGAMVLELPYSDPRELLGDVLRHGLDVEVLGPPALCQLVRSTVQAMHQRWGQSAPAAPSSPSP